MCETYNKSPRADYYLVDATDQFPSTNYDVIVLDGALGHFSKDAAETLLRRIGSALSVGGMFVGSESLGQEGSDHLQFCVSPDHLRAILQHHFHYVQLRCYQYRVGLDGFFLRTEAYWRCSNDLVRLAEPLWSS